VNIEGDILFEWRGVPGLRVEVSGSGEVRDGSEILEYEDSDGCLFSPHVMATTCSGARVCCLVADLVLLAFSGERPKGGRAHWRNRDKYDNRISNLKWMTAAVRCDTQGCSNDAVDGFCEKCEMEMRRRVRKAEAQKRREAERGDPNPKTKRRSKKAKTDVATEKEETGES